MNNMISDLEYDLMEFCLREKGKWWANHYFRNKEVNDLYFKLRNLRAIDVFHIIGGTNNVDIEDKLYETENVVNAYRRLFSLLDPNEKVKLIDRMCRVEDGLNKSIILREWTELAKDR